VSPVTDPEWTSITLAPTEPIDIEALIVHEAGRRSSATNW
jgi:hypothetical protein